MATQTSHERVPFHLFHSSFPAGTCENFTTGHAVSWHPFFSSHKSSDIILLPGGWNGAGLGIPQRQDRTTPCQQLTLQLSLIEGSRPPRSPLNLDLLSHYCATMQTQPPEVPWGQIFTFPRLQNMFHQWQIACHHAQLSCSVSTCTAHR